MEIIRKNIKNIILSLLVIFTCVIIDQLTKFYVEKYVYPNQIKVIDNFFNIVYVTNDGAAWSILQGQRLILIVVPIIVIIFCLIFLTRTLDKLLAFSLAMVVGGGLGNLIDRIFKGSVVDFFEFFIFGYSFPVFNMADTFVVIGTALLVIYILFIYKEDRMAYIPFKKKEESDG